MLRLVLKGVWFDMIDSGVKLEEYRVIKDYWILRLCKVVKPYCRDFSNTLPKDYDLKDFKEVEFKHGYQKNGRKMVFKIESISIGEGRTEWGAEKGKKYFVIKLGKRCTQ